MFTVGLTGGIGAGKSVVGRLFGQLGVNVVDADVASRAIMEPGMPALQAVVQHYGSDILHHDGTLDRARLRSIVFADEHQRRWLEQLTHPLIGQWIRERLAHSPPPYAILETPLLFETSQKDYVHRKLVVDVPEEVQVARTISRDDNSEEQVRAIIAAQMPRSERVALADDVIDNTVSLEALHKRVLELHQQYLVLARAHAKRHPSAPVKPSGPTN